MAYEMVRGYFAALGLVVYAGNGACPVIDVEREAGRILFSGIHRA
nr:hypothetical protein OG999_42895 [Streptomyces sp. NBC_00886]